MRIPRTTREMAVLTKAERRLLRRARQSCRATLDPHKGALVTIIDRLVEDVAAIRYQLPRSGRFPGKGESNVLGSG